MMVYYGQVLEFNKDGTCVFQWWQNKAQNKKDGKWEDISTLIKDCRFTAIYPRITTATLFAEDYKIEQIAI